MTTLIHSFTIGGQADTALGVELQAGYDEPMLPGTRDRTLKIAGRQGMITFGSDLDAREFNLPLAMIEPSTAAALQAVVRTFAAVLLDKTGKPKDVSLVFVKEPNKTYTVRYSGALSLARLIGNTHGEFTLPLIAADPYAYGSEVTTSETITTNPQTVTVQNDGDYATPPIIQLVNNGGAGITGITLTIKSLKG